MQPVLIVSRDDRGGVDGTERGGQEEQVTRGVEGDDKSCFP